MSTNLLYNPKFDLPLINTNTFKLYPNFTTADITALYWSSVNYNNIAILNGVNAYGYPSPSLLNCTQAISLQSTSDISQTVTIFDLVTYQLKFNYVGRPNPNNYFVFNPVDVFINDVLVYTVSTYTTSWTEITIDYTPTDFGSCVIQFKTYDNGQGQDQNVCLTNINFFQKNTTEGGGAPGGTSKMVTYNSLKNTNIYGYLNVNDLNVNGGVIGGLLRTPKILLGGIDTATKFTTALISTNRINFNYETIPGNNVDQLGHLATYNFAGGSSVAANIYATISVNIYPGVYLIDAYALFNITTVNNTVRLGMNTVIYTANTAYNYSSLFVPSVAQQSINYNYVLRNTTARTFYFFIIQLLPQQH